MWGCSTPRSKSQGKLFVTTELGGGGTATAASSRIAIRGARNLLRHVEILPGDVEISGQSVMLNMPGEECFHFADEAGLLQPLADLGDRVDTGQPLARIWPADRTGRPPVEVLAQMEGVVAARHFPGLVQMGDCLAVLATA